MTGGGPDGEARGNRLLATLADVLQAHAMRHVFQPLWDGVTGHLMGFEALARFDGAIPPDRLFHLAATTPWWPELDLLSLESALEAGRDLPGRLFMNVSARFLELPEPERERALGLFARYRPRLDTVVLEVTETAVSDPIRASAGARFWQRQGVLLALDDAGSGASAPDRVTLLRPDYVKIDIGLTRRWLAGDPDPLVRWSEWAETIGAVVIVEGLEERADREAFRLLGRFGIQGYAFGTPLPAPEWTPAHLQAVAPIGQIRPRSEGIERTSRLARIEADTAWPLYRRVEIERLLTGARDLVLPVLVGSWFVSSLRQGAVPPWPADAVAALGVGWTLASRFTLAGARSDTGSRVYGASLIDGAWTVAWIAVTGGGASPYLPLLLWQMLLALFRLPTLPAIVATMVYTAIYAGLSASGRTTALYVAIFAVTMAISWQGFDRAHPRHARDDVTGFFVRPYGLFLLRRALADHRPLGLVALRLEGLGAARRPEDRVRINDVVAAVASVTRQAFYREVVPIRYDDDLFLVVYPDGDGPATRQAAAALLRAVTAMVFPADAHDRTFRLNVDVGWAVTDGSADSERLVRTVLAAVEAARQRADHLAGPAGDQSSA